MRGSQRPHRYSGNLEGFFLGIGKRILLEAPVCGDHVDGLVAAAYDEHGLAACSARTVPGEDSSLKMSTVKQDNNLITNRHISKLGFGV